MNSGVFIISLSLIGYAFCSIDFNVELKEKDEYKIPSLNVSWDVALHVGIDEITVQYEKVLGYPENTKKSVDVFQTTNNRDQNYIVFDHLDYDSKYEISLTKHMGEVKMTEKKTQVVAGFIPKVMSSSQCEIILRSREDARKKEIHKTLSSKIRFHYVYVYKIINTVLPNVSDVTSDMVRNNRNIYMALKLENATIEDYSRFIIGDEKEYAGHTNYPLEERTKYAFFQRTELKDGTIINYSWTEIITTNKTQNSNQEVVPSTFLVTKNTADIELIHEDFARFYEIYTMKLNDSNEELMSPDLITADVVKNNERMRIAMKIKANKNVSSLTLGDGQNYSGHTNSPLLENTNYAFFQRIYFEDQYPRDVVNTNWSVPLKTSNHVPKEADLDGDEIVYITAGTALGLIALIFCIICCCHYKYSLKYSPPPAKKSGKTQQAHRLTTDPSIPVTDSDFYDHMAQMKFHNFKGFYEEFSLMKVEFKASESFRNPDNAMKNRFVNIPCYDHSRVKLDGEDNVTSYIHANYVPGNESDQDYIITQSPLLETIQDFWAMVYKENVTTIVMVGELIEKGNQVCAPYFPTAEHKELHAVGQITLVREYITADYAVRVLSLKVNKEVRTIQHFQFLGWPTVQIAPPCPTAFLKFVKVILKAREQPCGPTFVKVNLKEREQPSGPTVVHGTTGSGREGIYACVDAQIRRVIQQKDVNVYDCVRSVRENRFDGIKTLDEYIFVHETVLEFILKRNIHDIPVQHLPTYIENITKGSNEDELFSVEYKFLSSTVVSSTQKMSVANLPINRKKNRYDTIKPFDENRVKLTKLMNREGSDYINASWVDTYVEKKGFITTQAPLVDTLGDFWRMIYETKSWVIVMLGQEIENGQVWNDVQEKKAQLKNVNVQVQLKADRFWPEEGSVMALDYLSVKLITISADVIKDVIVRQIEVMDTRTSDTKLIQMYQYLRWPSHKDITSESIHSLVQLTQQSAMWKDKLKANAVTVVSSSGIGRPGVLIALQSLQEEGESEGTVNIFRTVQRLRQQRAALVQTREDYILIYTSTLEITQHVRRRSIVTASIDLSDLGVEILPSGYDMSPSGSLSERQNSRSVTSTL